MTALFLFHLFVLATLISFANASFARKLRREERTKKKRKKEKRKEKEKRKKKG